MLPKEGGGGFGDVVEREAEVALVLAEAFRCRVRQARQAVEGEVALVLAETFRRRVRQARQADAAPTHTAPAKPATIANIVQRYRLFDRSKIVMILSLLGTSVQMALRDCGSSTMPIECAVMFIPSECSIGVLRS